MDLNGIHREVKSVEKKGLVKNSNNWIEGRISRNPHEAEDPAERSPRKLSQVVSYVGHCHWFPGRQSVINIHRCVQHSSRSELIVKVWAE